MTKRALLPILGVLLLAHAPSTAHGQQFVAGDTIRVRASEGQWTDATVARLVSDTLWYESNEIVSPISIDNAEIRRPTHRNHRWSGLGIGAVAGGAAGALIAYARHEPRLRREGPWFCVPAWGCDPGPLVQVNSRAEETATGAVGGALIGGGLGYGVGMLLGRWESVELDQITVGDGNLAVSMSIRR